MPQTQNFVPRQALVAIVCWLSLLTFAACEKQNANDAKSAGAATELEAARQESGAARDPGGAISPRSVVLIGIDTLRADHLGLYGAERATSPFLNETASEAAVFEWAFATAAWTLPSFASMLTGLDPAAHGAGVPLRGDEDSKLRPAARPGVRQRTRLDPSVRTLAEQLAAHGMSTLAVLQNPNLDPTFGLNRGFDVYDFDGAVRRDGRHADAVVDRALQLLDERDGEPFFMFLQFQDPHLTYDAPVPHRGKFTRELEAQFAFPVEGVRKLRERFHEMPHEEREFIEAAYDEEISFVDAQIRRLMLALAERGLDDQTLVILSADHGEEFFDHGGFEHGHSNYNELIRVPLMVWGPGVESGRALGPASVADIPPTILDALGLQVPGDTFGVSLWPAVSDPASEAGKAVVESLAGRLVVASGVLYGPALRSGIRWPHKLIERPEDGKLLLFDLVADPAEQFDLSTSLPDKARALRDELRTTTEAYGANTRRETVNLDSETEERLRALGYVE